MINSEPVASHRPSRRKVRVLKMALRDTLITPLPEMKYFSTKGTEKYAAISEKTIQRDLDLIADMD
jgi:hypothetical protein